MINNHQSSMFIFRATLLAAVTLLSSADLNSDNSGTYMNRGRIVRSPGGIDLQTDVPRCPPDEGCNDEHVTYRKGSTTGWPPVVISAPHAGTRLPDSIPNRDAGCWDQTTSTCVWSHTCGVKNFTLWVAEYVTLSVGFVSSRSRKVTNRCFNVKYNGFILIY